MSITPDKAPESLLASDPNALFLKRTDEINELLDSGASLSGHERNCFFLNTGDGMFATASATSGFDFYDDARAVARSDWDHDGDIDLLFANRTAPRLRFLKNESEGSANFVAVKLIGTSSNRDAIGARVILNSGDRTLLRGLRAGEGFLGQSSKWLHFGLGDSGTIDGLTVHWPGGKSETFPGLKSKKWFTLKQGTGKASLWTPPARDLKLAEKEFVLPIPTAQAAVRLCARMPIPQLHALGDTGKMEAITPTKGRPLFVTLWASWCPACDQEFKDLAEHAAQLDEAGIDTLALSVNGIGDGDDTTFEDAEGYLKKLGLKLKHRRAHPDLLHQLQLIANRIIAQNEPLPLPSGFLLDSQGLVTAFYRGPAPIDHLVTTAGMSDDASAMEIFKSALPFSGTWIGGTRSHPVDRLVSKFIEAGFVESALTFAKNHKKSFANANAYAEVFSQVGNHHADQGEFDTAITYYREALTEHEEAPLIHFNLALALEREKKQAEALIEYQRAIELDPKITVAHLNRGAILARSPATLKEGTASLQRAVELNPNLAASHYHLGMALERSGQIKPAFQHYYQAYLLAPDHFGNAMQLAHLLERTGKVEEALTEYQKIARIHPNNPQVPFQSGMACEKLTRPDEAITFYKQALELSPQYLPALNNLAFLLSSPKKHGDPAAALVLATKAAKLTNHQHAAILDTLASAQLANQDQEGARQALKKAIALAAKNNQKALLEELRRKAALLPN
jgi:tetratricopeptide (TPR) repeat protein